MVERRATGSEAREMHEKKDMVPADKLKEATMSNKHEDGEKGIGAQG